MDGSPSEIGRNVYGETMDFLQHVHDGSGKPMWDGRSRYYPSIRPSTREEIAFFEARQRQLAEQEMKAGSLADMLEFDSTGWRCCSLFEVFDMPDDGEVPLKSSSSGRRRRRGTGDRMADPTSVEEWLMHVQRHERTARTMSKDKVAAAEGYFHAGLAVECALKAYSMRRERLNGWPSKDARPELYTHNLYQLMRIAEIRPGPRDPEAPSWVTVLAWDRNAGYDPKTMPRRFAGDMVEAAFGEKGAVTWIRSNLT